MRDDIQASINKHRKIVLVSGASSGIGKAVADRLSHQYVVYGGSRRLCSPGSWAHHELDVADVASVSTFVEYVLEREDRIDALIAQNGTDHFAQRFLTDAGLDWGAALLADFPDFLSSQGE